MQSTHVMSRVQIMSMGVEICEVKGCWDIRKSVRFVELGVEPVESEEQEN